MFSDVADFDPNKLPVHISHVSLDQSSKLSQVLGLWQAKESKKQNSMHIALCGDLAAGKTTWTRLLAKAIGVDNADEIESPSYTYHLDYQIPSSQSGFYHYDFYRLNSIEQAEQINIHQSLHQKGLHCIEWANLYPSLIHKKSLWIYMHHDKINPNLLDKVTMQIELPPSQSNFHERHWIIHNQYCPEFMPFNSV